MSDKPKKPSPKKTKRKQPSMRGKCFLSDWDNVFFVTVWPKRKVRGGFL